MISINAKSIAATKNFKELSKCHNHHIRIPILSVDCRHEAVKNLLYGDGAIVGSLDFLLFRFFLGGIGWNTCTDGEGIGII
jgi:hypothetical protein